MINEENNGDICSKDDINLETGNIYVIKNYIGCKIIQAIPMDASTFKWDSYNEGRTTEEPPVISTENAPGYKVIYPDGYVSWSPKDVFENAYRVIQQNEIELLK